METQRLEALTLMKQMNKTSMMRMKTKMKRKKTRTKIWWKRKKENSMIS